VASSSLTRDRTWAPCIERAVLATGPPGNSNNENFLETFGPTPKICFFKQNRLCTFLDFLFVFSSRKQKCRGGRAMPFIHTPIHPSVHSSIPPCSLRTYSIFVVVQWLSHVRLFMTPWTESYQTSESFTISWSLLKLTSTESKKPSKPSYP